MRNRLPGRGMMPVRSLPEERPPMHEAAVILGLILLNALFASAELALVSARRSRLQALAEEGHRGAKAALALLDDPTRLLSSVQMGITLVGILTGVYSGAAYSAELAAWITSVPPRWRALCAGDRVRRHRRRDDLLLAWWSASWCPSAWRWRMPTAGPRSSPYPCSSSPGSARRWCGCCRHPPMRCCSLMPTRRRRAGTRSPMTTCARWPPRACRPGRCIGTKPR